MFVAAALFAAPAGAALHPFLGTAARNIPIGKDPLTGKVITQPFNNTCGVAIDSSGQLYVSDYQNDQIAIFDDKGKFLDSIPIATAENSTCGLAVGNGGRLFANHFHGSVRNYGFGGGVIDQGRSTGVAVDPSTDTLYVTHRSHVSAYEAPATPGDIPTTIGAGSLSDAYGAAVSGFGATFGHLYVAEAANDTVKVFDPATDPATPIATIDGSETPLGEFRDLTDASLAVDDSNGHLFVLDNLQPGFEHPIARVYEFDADGVYVGQIGHWVEEVVPPPPSPPKPPAPPPPPLPPKFFQRVLIHGGPSGIAIDNSPNGGTIYVSSGDEVQVIDTSVEPEEEEPPEEPEEPEEETPGLPEIPEEEAPKGPKEVGTPVYAFCPAQPTLEQVDDGLCSPTPQPSHPLAIAKLGGGEGIVTSILLGVNYATLPGIECGTICATEYDEGTQLTLSATPRPHSSFTGWSVNGSSSTCPGTTPFCKVTITSETEVSANFKAIPQQSLSVAMIGSGQGTITTSPAGIECGMVCSSVFDEGSTVTLTAETFTGSEFLGWSGGGCLGTSSCKVKMQSAQSVSANFQAIPRIIPVDKNLGSMILAISVTGEGAGTISSSPAGIECGTPCSGAYPPGTKVTLTAKADPESRFLGFSGCDSQTASTTCTVAMSSSRTIGAAFAEARPLELGGVSLNGAKAILEVSVPVKGTLSAKAKEIKPVSVKARKAQRLALPLSLTKAAKRKLAKQGKLKVKVTLTFKPSGGGEPRSLEKTIVFRAKSGKRQG